MSRAGWGSPVRKGWGSTPPARPSPLVAASETPGVSSRRSPPAVCRFPTSRARSWSLGMVSGAGPLEGLLLPCRLSPGRSPDTLTWTWVERWPASLDGAISRQPDPAESDPERKRCRPVVGDAKAFGACRGLKRSLRHPRLRTSAGAPVRVLATRPRKSSLAALGRRGLSAAATTPRGSTATPTVKGAPRPSGRSLRSPLDCGPLWRR